MIYYKAYDFQYLINKNKIGAVLKSKYKCVLNNVLTFDTETTTLYKINNEWQGFDYSLPPDYYTDNKIQSSSFVYIWQFGFEDIVYFGRSIESFKLFITQLLNDLKEYTGYDELELYIYVHNLPYDAVYLFNIFDIEKSFQRKPHKQMFFTTKENITFKDSYVYSNLSLSSISKNNTLYKKLDGNEFDYTKVRFPWSKLTYKELKYCENDIKALWEYLTREKKTYYGKITNLPLTNTGKVRRALQREIKEKDYKLIYKCQDLVPYLHIYKDLLQLFMGGVAHSNCLYNGQKLFNVKSKDYTSSYPFVLLSEKYPCSTFMKWTGDKSKIINNKNVVWYATLDIYDFICINSFPYLPSYKAMQSKEITVDNGRVFSGGHFRMLVTNVDYEIIIENYVSRETFNQPAHTLSNIYFAKADYLSDTEREFILDLYVDKTKYKDDNANIDLYMNSKNMFNAIYGMQVIQLVSPEVMFDNDTKDFFVDENFNDETMIEQLNKQRTDKKLVTSFARGVWCTAYARRNLYLPLDKMDRLHTIYCDTDSVKYIEDYDGQYDELFNEINKMHYEKLLKALPKHLQEKIAPIDIKGKAHLIGELDTEKGYDEFKTFGAKKYAYLQDGKIGITVAGLNKQKGAKKLKTLDDFILGQVWGYFESGRTTAKYNNNQQPIEIDGRVIKYKCGVTLQPTTYKLSLSKEYNNFLLENAKGYVEFSKDNIYRKE